MKLSYNSYLECYQLINEMVYIDDYNDCGDVNNDDNAGDDDDC